MVSLLTLKEKYPYLFNEIKVPQLEELISDAPSFIYKQIVEKNKKSLNEKKYLSWLRHSLAFQKKIMSPEKILESWTSDVKKLLKEEWDQIFKKEDEIILSYMGKLGSNELNLSSDIDVIFFGKMEGNTLKVRKFLDAISCPHLVPRGFKVDLDLKPEGRSGNLITSVDKFGNHIWNSSDPWERYSYSRMRIDLGNKKIADEVYKIRNQYCYRKYLSSNFFHSFLELRKKYQENLELNEINLKLGPGGIRDIELFVQTFQILYGGKNKDFIDKSTFELLDLFIEKNINKANFEKLKIAYFILRQAEGELHSQSELAGFKWKRTDEWGKDVIAAMHETESLILEYANSNLNIFGVSEKSFSRNAFIKEIDKYFDEDRYKKNSAKKNFEQYFPEKNRRFTPYIRAILSQDKVKASFMDLLAYSNYGCQILSRRPSLLDVFLLREVDIDRKDEQKFLDSISDVKMLQRILASNTFAKTNDLLKLGEDLSDSYEFILNNLVDPKTGLDFLFLGKMASKELGLNSDLDFVLIYDKNKDEVGDGDKQAKILYKELSHLTIFGPLVPFDREGWPGGAASPILIKYENLIKFLSLTAEPWQKLMYLKHRWLFNKERINFLSTKATKEDLMQLREILDERTSAYNVQKDELKLSKGGLFHSEYLIGAGFLKLGLQPKEGIDFNSMAIELGALMGMEKLLEKVVELYNAIAISREHSILLGRLRINDPFKMLDKNLVHLKELEKHIFN